MKKIYIILLAVGVGMLAFTASGSSWQYGGRAIRGTVAYPDVIDLGNGQYRMYYNAAPETTGSGGQVYSALSVDGVNWAQETGVRMTGASYPEVLDLGDGTYRMYFQRQKVIKSAVSCDGLTWVEESGTRMGTNNASGLTLESVANPTVLKVTAALYVMVYQGVINERYSQTVPNTNTSLLLGSISVDGVTFGQGIIILDSRNETFKGMLTGPEFEMWADGVNRLYFGSYGGIYHILYAQTFTQDAVLDYTTGASVASPANQAADPSYMLIASRQYLYYSQATGGIYFATDQPWKVYNDFDGDGRTDPAVYYPSSGTWLILQTSDYTLRTEHLGGGSYLPAPGDFDGDRVTDLVVFNSATADWHAKLSCGWEGGVNFGWAGTWPVSADFDADYITDLAVYDPQTGFWCAFLSRFLSSGSITWGRLGDFRSWENPQTYTILPMPFDYNQDGADDLAYYYRGLSMADSTWTILYVGVGANTYTWGSSGSLPVPGYCNYVNAALGQEWAKGIGVYKISTAEWNIPYRNNFFMGTYKQTLPVPAGDYDGNGYTDNAVYNYDSGLWTIVFNTDELAVSGRTSVSFVLGNSSAVPANIYSTIYALGRYSPEPW